MALIRPPASVVMTPSAIARAVTCACSCSICSRCSAFSRSIISRITRFNRSVKDWVRSRICCSSWRFAFYKADSFALRTSISSPQGFIASAQISGSVVHQALNTRGSLIDDQKINHQHAGPENDDRLPVRLYHILPARRHGIECGLRSGVASFAAFDIIM